MATHSPANTSPKIGRWLAPLLLPAMMGLAGCDSGSPNASPPADPAGEAPRDDDNAAEPPAERTGQAAGDPTADEEPPRRADNTISGTDGPVFALAAHDGEVYVGGRFTRAGTLQTHNIARWDGEQWHPLGTGLRPRVTQGGATVRAIAVDDDGTLYAAGQFRKAGGVDAMNVARWDGRAWHPLGAGLRGDDITSKVLDIAVAGDEVYAVGPFTRSGKTKLDHVARWDGESWSPVGAVEPKLTGPAEEVVVTDDDTLYMGGRFLKKGETKLNHIARWGGDRWRRVGNGVDGPVEVLASHEMHLYAGGGFSHIHHSHIHTGSDADEGAPPPQPAGGLARWDGSEWTGLNVQPGEALALSGGGRIRALALSGGYVGGNFHTPRGIRSIVQRGQTPRKPLGSGLGLGNPSGGRLVISTEALAMVDEDLFVGGMFRTAGGRPARHIARWDGERWHALGAETPVEWPTVVVSSNSKWTRYRKIEDIDLSIRKQTTRVGTWTVEWKADNPLDTPVSVTLSYQLEARHPDHGIVYPVSEESLTVGAGQSRTGANNFGAREPQSVWLRHASVNRIGDSATNGR